MAPRSLAGVGRRRLRGRRRQRQRFLRLQVQRRTLLRPSGGGDGGGGGAKLALAADPGGKIAFDKKALSAKAGKTTIDLTNASQVPHAVEVEGNGVEEESKTIQGGKASVTVDLKPGSYTFYCPVGDHEQQGMKGTLTVK